MRQSKRASSAPAVLQSLATTVPDPHPSHLRESPALEHGTAVEPNSIVRNSAVCNSDEAQTSLPPVAPNGVKNDEHWEMVPESIEVDNVTTNKFALRAHQMNRTSLKEEFYKIKEQLTTYGCLCSAAILYEFTEYEYPDILRRTDVARYLNTNNLDITQTPDWDVSYIVGLSLMVWDDRWSGGLWKTLGIDCRQETIYRLQRLLRNKGAHRNSMGDSYIFTLIYVVKLLAVWARSYQVSVRIASDQEEKEAYERVGGADVLRHVQQVEGNARDAFRARAQSDVPAPEIKNIRQEILSLYPPLFHTCYNHFRTTTHLTHTDTNVRTYNIQYARMLGTDPLYWPTEHLANFLVQHWPKHASDADDILGKHSTPDPLHVYLSLLTPASDDEWNKVLFCMMALWNASVLAGVVGRAKEMEADVARIEGLLALWC